MVLLAAAAAFAQPAPLKITKLVLIPDADNFDVNFNQAVADVAGNVDLANLTLTPASLAVKSIARVGLRPNILRVTLASKIKPGTAVRVVFGTIQGPGELEARGLAAEAVAVTFEDFKKAFLKMQESFKASSEKNIFASGFVTTASTGTQGGMDLALNPNLGIPGLTSFLQIKKSTQAGADPKNFEAGARYRGVLPTAGKMFAEIGRAADEAAIASIVAAHQKGIWQQLMAGTLVDFAGKLEGMGTSFAVANFVGESAVQFRTRTKRFVGRHGYWRGYLLPFGFEGGRGLEENAGGTVPRKVDWLARYKAGLGTTFFYENWYSEFPIRRVELDANGVVRNLFFDERRYDAATKLTDRTGKGVRGYGQVDLKIYLGQSEKGRYGLRLSYNRGSLPPVYSRVKSFQFGFLIETSDDSVERR